MINKGILALVLLSGLYATAGVFGRYLNTDFALFQQVYIRIFLATLLSLAFFYKYIDFKNFLKVKKSELLLLYFRGSLKYLAVVLFTYAVIETKLANVSLVALVPVISILSILFLGEKYNYKKMILIVFSILGVLFIGKDDFSFSIGVGEKAALLADLLFSIALITRKKHSNILSNKELTFGMLLGGTITTLVFSILLGEGIPSVKLFFEINLVVALFSAALLNVIIVFLMNYGFSKVSGILSDRILTLEVFFALLLGLIIYSEVPTVVEIIGMIIIITSVILLQIEENKNIEK